MCVRIKEAGMQSADNVITFTMDKNAEESETRYHFRRNG